MIGWLFKGSTSKRKFWPTGCLSTTSSTAENDKKSTALVPTNNSGNSSLYSQYDVTLNSSVEMDAAREEFNSPISNLNFRSRTSGGVIFHNCLTLKEM